ncbi:MAG: 6-bladed beta-propeller, partial [Desulfobulbaceae bacterium]|nr:6-bladed beta-propeller [Desulfobulbaceae bacterium]
MKKTLIVRKGVALSLSILLLAGLAVLPGTAAAAVMPALERLSPLSEMISSPTDVALDRQGRAYVAETSANRIVIYNQSGEFSGRVLAGVVQPGSVAVDNGGRILVGSAANGSVAVFGSDLAYLFSLGAGAGEFGIPSDIAVDDNGSVYVADSLNQTVRIYNSNGDHTGSIGVPGNEPGQLHNPTSVAIDANSGEIIILDHQQVYDSSSSKMVDGARIQYFAMDGTPLRSYSRFGYNNTGTTELDPDSGIKKAVYDIGMGRMTRPVQLTVDSMSRVYVTDMRMQNVMVYDNQDNFLGAIDAATCTLAIPQGIAIGAANRLYIASKKTKQIEVIGVDDYTSLLAAPTVVDFRHTETGTAPPAQEAAISNQGKTSFSWTASTPDGWVSLGTTSGTLAAAETSSLAVAVVPEGMAPGKYTGSVAINTGAGAAEDIQVVLQVDPNPLQVAPASLNLATVAGTAPEGQLLALTSAVEEPQAWEASADQPWITLDKT